MESSFDEDRQVEETGEMLASRTWMKVTLLGNLEVVEEKDQKRGGADRGPRLTLKDRGKGRKGAACVTS